LKLAYLVLTEKGHEETRARTRRRSGQEIFRSEPPAILLDPEPPGIGGLTVVGYFKGDAKRRPIGIIVISASAEGYRRGLAMAVATARS
jgi:CheY-like chemotaxis protein